MLVCVEDIVASRNYKVEATTGPMMLWRSIQMYAQLGRKGKDPELKILRDKLVYPLNWRPGHFDTRCSPDKLIKEAGG